MEKEKIFNKLVWVKCVKREIDDKAKKFIFYEMKTSSAGVSFGNVFVTKEFFDTFSLEERRAILYHEEYHQLFSTGLKRFYYLIRFLFNLKKMSWEEEFSADKYASIKVGKKNIISFLKKSQKLYENGTIAYNSKTHPTINERVENIKKT